MVAVSKVDTVFRHQVVTTMGYILRVRFSLLTPRLYSIMVSATVQ